MRAFSMLLLMLLSPITSGVAICAESKEQTVTLAEVCAEAIDGNISVLVARCEAAAAYQREKQARSQYWPSIDVSEQAVRTDDPGLSVLQLSRQNRAFAGGRPSSSDFRTQIEMNYLLFDFGARVAKARAAMHQHRSSLQQVKIIRSEMLVAVVHSFFSTLYAHEEVRILAREVMRMEERLKVANAQKEAGRGLASDILSAEYHLRRAQIDLLAADFVRNNAREQLGRLLGRPGHLLTERLIEEKNSPLITTEHINSIEIAEKEGIGASPVMQRMKEVVAAQKAVLRSARAERWPTVSVMGRFFQNNERFGRYEEHQNSYQAGVSLSWNVFDGGRRSARVREADQILQAKQASRDDAANRVRIDCRRIWRNLQVVRQDLGVSEKKILYNEADFNEKEIGYQKGRTSFHDLLEAQTDLAVSKLERIRARFQIKQSAARLLEVTGFWAVWPREKETTVAGVPTLRVDEMK